MFITITVGLSNIDPDAINHTFKETVLKVVENGQTLQQFDVDCEKYKYSNQQ